MNNILCTKTQKKLMFVPILNLLIPFVWLYNCRVNRFKIKDIFIGSMWALVGLLPFGLIQFLCGLYWENFAIVFAGFSIYLAPMLIGYLLIRHQQYIKKRYSEKTELVVVRNISNKALLICLGVLIVLVFIASVAIFISKDFKEKSIPDQNGAEDFSLAVLTLEDLTSEHIRSVVIGKHIVMRGSDTDVPEKHSEFDRDFLDISFRSISGVRTIHTTKTDCNELTLSVESAVEAGNAALVVLVDGKYFCHININRTDTVTIKNISGKLVEVRLAGESAKIKVSINRIVQ